MFPNKILFKNYIQTAIRADRRVNRSASHAAIVGSLSGGRFMDAFGDPVFSSLLTPEQLDSELVSQNSLKNPDLHYLIDKFSEGIAHSLLAWISVLLLFGIPGHLITFTPGLEYSARTVDFGIPDDWPPTVPDVAVAMSLTKTAGGLAGSQAVMNFFARTEDTVDAG